MNTLYSKILLAIDSGPQSLYIARRALALAKLNQAECIFLHVIEPSITYVAEFNKNEKKIDQSKVAAQKSLQTFCATLGNLHYHKMCLWGCRRVTLWILRISSIVILLFWAVMVWGAIRIS